MHALAVIVCHCLVQFLVRTVQLLIIDPQVVVHDPLRLLTLPSGRLAVMAPLPVCLQCVESTYFRQLLFKLARKNDITALFVNESVELVLSYKLGKALGVLQLGVVCVLQDVCAATLQFFGSLWGSDGLL